MIRASLFVGLCFAGASATLPDGHDMYLDSFSDFKAKFNKVYADEVEELTRFENFVTSVKRAMTNNVEHGDGVFGITKFSDLSREEFKQYLGFVPQAPEDRLMAAEHEVFQGPTNSTTATSYDWRDHGALTAVKDQEQCGSCWAFSATEQIESQWFLAGNKLTSFAPQQIVACDKVDAGCNGGDTPTAYQYVESAGGMATSASYPYTAGGGNTGKCKSFTVAGGNLSGYTYATPACTSNTCKNQDETTLAANLASTAPVSICVDAEPWQDYTGGVMKSSGSGCSNGYYDLDHCVQLVGFNKDAATPYWIVRNSWNTNWGEDGFIYLEMGKNTCGVADEATFVTIKN